MSADELASGAAVLHTAGGLASKECAEVYKYLAGICEWSDSDLVLQFLHAIIDDMCGREQSYVKRFQACGNADAILGSVKAYRLFFRSAISYDLSNEQLGADLETCGVPQKFVAPIVSVLRSRVDELSQALRVAASRISSSYLSDFDWKLQTTVASKQLASFSEPKLLLSVATEDPDGNAKEKIIELTREDLDRLLGVFESIRAATQSLQS